MTHNFKVVCARNLGDHKRPYTIVVKNTLLHGTWNNALVNQYKEAS